ncbi:MAG: hypothetical protein E8D41_02310 [Nitrospira sp.]|nr:MAG: hypothetical protein E8D41_02310 [Nitrospira sp.]
MKVPLTKIYENLDFVTDRLSTQTRTLTLGVLSLVWLFLSGDKDAPALKLGNSREQLLAIAALCVLTLLIDAVQNLAYYLSSDAVRRAAESNSQAEAGYDETSLLRRLQQGCFWAKQIFASLATVWLLVVLVVSILK